ncbi:UDP-N-acetylmuramate--L-alanine ligase [Stackebrandtia albiflava]|uniref:UDP-N-acetylmuramate--L-alanine ligase n=1 Tax=Stackebrandtia albiflava TaxID=406432 RepID=A0A562VBS7_9ACTN|nr:UDP-N-acetylmuramate--L-alanine ligase [Stackebrandtia albiflava]TWJ15277.1 UDP-N-acetylmuramate--L-alanine ligase [Stackebrandtia albiflava]
MTLTSPIDEGVTAEDLGHVLFVGVGGVGMSGLARLYATRGLRVSGSELHDWPSLVELAKLGVTVHREHLPANLDGVDTLVRSTATPEDHVELVEARRRGIRVYHRSEALAAAMTGKNSIVVAGTHGKTTTTAMITELLTDRGLAPSFVNGGESPDGRSGQHGHGDHFVIEADESDRSFLRYRPDVAVLTNIDADHLNNYESMDGLKDGFAEFLMGVTPDGLVIVCADDPAAAEVGARLAGEGRRVLTYGTVPGADLRISAPASSNDGVTYRAEFEGRDLGEFRLPVPGAHLGLNSAAAVLVGLHLGLDPDDVRKGLSGFAGVRRRFELTGTVAGVRVYDEYAYHPTAMNAALTTLKGLTGETGRLVVVFQPYRVYRTRDFRTEIARALSIADLAVVMEVFGPGEELPPGDGGEALWLAVPLPADHKWFVSDWAQVAPLVADITRPGDVVVTMGAPPIALMPAEIRAALAE